MKRQTPYIKTLCAIISGTIMTIIEKIKEIKRIQEQNSGKALGMFNSPIEKNQIVRIEELLEEPLTEEFRELYLFANGQSYDGKGLLLGERFITSDEIVKQLEFSRTLIKPEVRNIDNLEKSKNLLDKIVDFYLSKAPKHEMFGLKKAWFKIEFNCGVGSYGGPYIYANENTTSKERKPLKIEDYSSVSSIIKELHELEKKSYNWDELNFIVYANGKYEVERSFFNFDNEISFTSTPEYAIRKKYFHYKWIPLFSDYGGNFIGIDLDPDKNGKKGQIINFGRDEENMFVLGNDLNDFFDLILKEIKKPEGKLLDSETHLHDILKELK
jgi:cell wall assembly regulator SMI1